MKKHILLSYLLFLPLLAFYACDDPNYQTGEIAAPALELDMSKVEFTSASNSRTVEVTCSVRDWEFELANPNDAKWLTITKDGGIKLVLAANPLLDTRQAKIIVTAGNLKEELLVVQQGIKPTFTLKPTSLTFAAGGETKSVVVTTNVASNEWSVKVGDDFTEWCQAERTSETEKEDGTIEYTVEVTTLAYTDFVSRKAVVYIESDRLKDFGLEPAQLSVTQKAVTGTIDLPNNGTLELTKAGGAFKFTVTSPQQLLDVDVAALPGWIKNAEATLTVKTDGSSTIEVKGEADANTSSKRSTTLTFKLNDNDKTATMNIEQEGGMQFEKIALTAESFYSNAPDPSEGKDYGALIDDNTGTYWHSSWRGNVADKHYLIVDLGEEIEEGTNYYFSLTSRNHANANTPDIFTFQGRVTPYDNWFTIKDYTAAADGIIRKERATQFDFPVLTADKKFRYIRLEVEKCIQGQKFFTLSEFGFYKEKK
ncbi:BACON domain-containing protein [Bacteroides sp. 519]|uniref:BACON domain-containing protein n=1 Tax=Bacteroides sp. 519 TaxID=2302937 RepID=UPI0013D1844E|nr:BACON domain-containing carbohydrate-binding protein [Bacteroides sp. 519]NDV60664.1 hypothetical protein [Bacteroides sp. 519]